MDFNNHWNKINKIEQVNHFLSTVKKGKGNTCIIILTDKVALRLYNNLTKTWNVEFTIKDKDYILINETGDSIVINLSYDKVKIRTILTAILNLFENEIISKKHVKISIN
jgi:hypothetical protein